MAGIPTIIVDDENRSRKLLERLINNYCKDCSIVGNAASVKEAKKLIDNKKPALVFLDIEMPHGNGFDLLQSFDQINFEVIFVTGFAHYAIHAIKSNALDYLLKPIDVDELKLAVEKAKQKIFAKNESNNLKEILVKKREQEDNNSKILIPNREGRQVIAIDSIVRCTAEGIYTWFYINGQEKILSTRNLGEYEKILPDVHQSTKSKFFRVHHKELINLNYIKQYNKKSKTLEMLDESIVPLAQRRVSEFVEILKQESLF